MNTGKCDLKTKILKVFVAAVFLNSILCPGARAQVEVAPTTQTQTVEVAQPGEDIVAPPLPKPGNVTVNFKDVDIKTVLHYLSEVSGVDIVPSPGVDGSVTMRLRDKPWEVALDIVTRNYGFAYSREKDIIRVMPKGRLQTEEPITEVIPLNYVINDQATANQNITQLLDAINSVIVEKAGEKATYLASANAIVVSAIPARVGTIKDMVAEVDKKTPQIMLEAKILEVQLDKTDQLGVDWNAVVSAAGAKRPITLPFMNGGMLPFIVGELQDRFFPVAGPKGTADRSAFPYYDPGDLFDPTATDPPTNSIFMYGTLDFSQFSAVLRLIDERDDTDVLSTPRITTLNNQTATIKVVQLVYLQKESKASDTANTVTVEFETVPREIGVILSVTPHVNERGEITVNLKPQVSSDLSFSELQVSGADNTVAMTYNTREAETQVMVRDGETIFIGGLILEQTEKQDHKFPILGDLLGPIPIVGNLFRYEQDNVSKTEVVFFVTVHLLKDGPDSIYDSRTVDYHNEYFPYKTPLAPERKEGSEAGEPALKGGAVKTTKHGVVVSTEPAGEEKKEYRPFLDFRKKEQAEKKSCPGT